MSHLLKQIASLENLHTAAAQVKQAYPFLRDREWLATDLDVKLETLGQQLTTGSFKPENVGYFYSIGEKKLCCATMHVRSMVAVFSICKELKGLLGTGTVTTCAYSVDEIDGLLQSCRQWKKSSKWALGTDIQQFFESVEHKLLLDSIAGEVNCKITMGLLGNLFAAFDEASARFSTESPAYQQRQGFGLPAGIELVYVLANAFLKPIDLVLFQAAQGKVARYIDDYLCFGDSEEEMQSTLAILNGELERIGLKLKPAKTFIQPCKSPISFLRQQV